MAPTVVAAAILALLAVSASVTDAANTNVHLTYHWHMQQPMYVTIACPICITAAPSRAAGFGVRWVERGVWGRSRALFHRVCVTSHAATGQRSRRKTLTRTSGPRSL